MSRGFRSRGPGARDLDVSARPPRAECWRLLKAKRPGAQRREGGARARRSGGGSAHWRRRKTCVQPHTYSFVFLSPPPLLMPVLL